MLLDFIALYADILSHALLISFSLTSIMAYSAWSSPGHRFEYEKYDIDFSKLRDKEKVNFIRTIEANCLSLFMAVVIVFVMFFVFLLLFLQFWVANVSSELFSRFYALTNGIIIVLALYFLGVIIEKVYQKLIIAMSVYADILSVKNKQFALYSVTLFASVFLLDIELFFIAFALFLGKFIWIDTHIQYKGYTVIKLVKEAIDTVKDSTIYRSIIRFNIALLLSSLALYIEFNNLFPIWHISLSPVAVILCYIFPFTRNLRSIRKGG